MTAHHWRSAADTRRHPRGARRADHGRTCRQRRCKAIARSRETVIALIQQGNPIYGVNTGFGKLAKTRIAAADLSRLQVNIVRSHAAGVGAPLARRRSCASSCSSRSSLAHGASGISLEAVDTLVALLNADILPVIPGQGSVGASGDLAPLAHMSLVLIGEGSATVKGKLVTGAAALAQHRPQAGGARSQGRPGASQRHAGLDRPGAFRPSRRRTQCRRRDPCRRHVGRCHHGLRHALRSAHSRIAAASRPEARGRRITAACSPAARSAPRI